MQKSKLNLKPFYALWFVMTAAYAVWMAFFLKFDTYPGNETGMNGSIGRYIAWSIFSVVALLLFPVYLKLFLGEKKPGKGLKLFCLINLVFAFAFITWYGFFRNPLELTASMIGLEFPWHFKMWGLFASLSIFTNVLYAYRTDGYFGKIGLTCGSIGCAAIYVTINVPSAGEDLILNSLRCMSHWTGALLFAFLGAGSIVVFLLHKSREKNIRYIIVTALFGAVLALMLILLVTVGKNGLIESLPMWAAYLVLFLINFTNLFRTEKQPDAVEQAKEPAMK